MKNTKIVVNTRSKSYPIYFGDGNLDTTGTLIKKNLPNVKKICIISDKNLPLVLLKKLSKSLKKYKYASCSLKMASNTGSKFDIKISLKILMI